MVSLVFAQGTVDVPPCPHCSSKTLTTGSWILDDEEVDAVECCKCSAGAPLKSWSLRSEERYSELYDYIFELSGAVAARKALELALSGKVSGE